MLKAVCRDRRAHVGGCTRCSVKRFLYLIMIDEIMTSSSAGGIPRNRRSGHSTNLDCETPCWPRRASMNAQGTQGPGGPMTSDWALMSIQLRCDSTSDHDRHHRRKDSPCSARERCHCFLGLGELGGGCLSRALAKDHGPTTRIVPALG